jgi:hypothetical protein
MFSATKLMSSFARSLMSSGSVEGGRGVERAALEEPRGALVEEAGGGVADDSALDPLDAGGGDAVEPRLDEAGERGAMKPGGRYISSSKSLT